MTQVSPFRLSDFFNYYVQTNQLTTSLYGNDVGFYDSINMKKEFSSLRSFSQEVRPPPGEPLPHQRFIARFFAPQTPYDRLLVFHGLGSGKSCVISAVVEHAKHVNPDLGQVIVLTRNESLQRNMLNEIKNCTCTNFKDKDRKHCEEGPYIKPNQEVLITEGDQDLSDAQRRDNAIRANIKRSYDVSTFLQMAKRVQLLRTQGLLEESFNNTYILIDEAHNIKDKTKDSKVDKYKEIWELLHTVKGSKVMLLTGTPMKDMPEREIVDILNLLLPRDNQLTISMMQSAFDPSTHRLINPDVLKERIKGIVSYVRSSQSSVQIVSMGEVIPPLRLMKVYPNVMHSHQWTSYIQAYASDRRSAQAGTEEEDGEDDSESRGIWLNTVSASLMVFPDGSFGPVGELPFIDLRDREGNAIQRVRSS